MEHFSLEEVYSALTEERAYQDRRWNRDTTSSGNQHLAGEFILYMEYYLSEARRILSTQADPQATIDALDMVRKVTALGVSCMQQNGIVRRKA